MRNRPELLEAMYAAFRIGACVVPLNARFTAEEVAYHLEDSSAAAVIADEDAYEAALRGHVGTARVVVTGAEAPGPGAIVFEELPSRPRRGTAPPRSSSATSWPGSSTPRAPRGAQGGHAHPLEPGLRDRLLAG